MKRFAMILWIFAVLLLMGGVAMIGWGVYWCSQERSRGEEVEQIAIQPLPLGERQTMGPIQVDASRWCRLGVIMRVAGTTKMESYTIYSGTHIPGPSYVPHSVPVQCRVSDDSGREIVSGSFTADHDATVRVINDGDEWRDMGYMKQQYFWNKVDDRFPPFKAPASGRITVQMQIGNADEIKTDPAFADTTEVQMVVYDRAYPKNYWMAAGGWMILWGVIAGVLAVVLAVAGLVFRLLGRRPKGGPPAMPPPVVPPVQPPVPPPVQPRLKVQ